MYSSKNFIVIQTWFEFSPKKTKLGIGVGPASTPDKFLWYLLFCMREWRTFTKAYATVPETVWINIITSLITNNCSNNSNVKFKSLSRIQSEGPPKDYPHGHHSPKLSHVILESELW